MILVWVGDGALSEKARQLVDFDVASIRQTVAGRKGEEPALWLVSMPQYEKNGRPLRDSTSPRLIAYAPGDRVLYTSDGCNCCGKAVPADLAPPDGESLKRVAAETGIAEPLLNKLIALTRES